MNTIVLSLFSTIIFGIIDALFFLLFEETMQGRIKKFINVSMNVAELITGAISAAAAIFIASNVRISIEEKIYLIHNPLLDVAGILIGTLIVVLSYIFYVRFLRCVLFKGICRK